MGYNMHAVCCRALKLEFDDVPERIRFHLVGSKWGSAVVVWILPESFKYWFLAAASLMLHSEHCEHLGFHKCPTSLAPMEVLDATTRILQAVRKYLNEWLLVQVEKSETIRFSSRLQLGHGSRGGHGAAELRRGVGRVLDGGRRGGGKRENELADHLGPATGAVNARAGRRETTSALL